MIDQNIMFVYRIFSSGGYTRMEEHIKYSFSGQITKRIKYIAKQRIDLGITDIVEIVLLNERITQVNRNQTKNQSFGDWS